MTDCTVPFLTLAVCQLPDGKLDVAAEPFREPHELKLLRFLGGVRVG